MFLCIFYSVVLNSDIWYLLLLWTMWFVGVVINCFLYSLLCH